MHTLSACPPPLLFPQASTSVVWQQQSFWNRRPASAHARLPLFAEDIGGVTGAGIGGGGGGGLGAGHGVIGGNRSGAGSISASGSAAAAITADSSSSRCVCAHVDVDVDACMHLVLSQLQPELHVVCIDKRGACCCVVETIYGCAMTTFLMYSRVLPAGRAHTVHGHHPPMQLKI